MERIDLSTAFATAFPVEPIPALIVPEHELSNFVLAARMVAFNADLGSLPNSARALVVNLDVESERFADMLSLDKPLRRRRALEKAARRVRTWVEAGSVTLPPFHEIRQLLEPYE
jgi:uncharacterized protein (DUF1778 family)